MEAIEGSLRRRTIDRIYDSAILFDEEPSALLQPV